MFVCLRVGLFVWFILYKKNRVGGGDLKYRITRRWTKSKHRKERTSFVYLFVVFRSAVIVSCRLTKWSITSSLQTLKWHMMMIALHTVELLNELHIQLRCSLSWAFYVTHEGQNICLNYLHIHVSCEQLPRFTIARIDWFTGSRRGEMEARERLADRELDLNQGFKKKSCKVLDKLSERCILLADAPSCLSLYQARVRVTALSTVVLFLDCGPCFLSPRPESSTRTFLCFP